MLLFKDGVRLRHVSTQGLFLLILIRDVYEEMGYDCIVTAVENGAHSAKSCHWEGDALDFRTRHLPTSMEKVELARRVRERLKPLGSDYFIDLENIGKPNEHLHGQFRAVGSM